MNLDFEDIIGSEFVSHTKNTLKNEELLTYYIDKRVGWNNLDRYIQTSNGQITYLDTISTYSLGHHNNEYNFINSTLKKLDKIIDLDFKEMLHNNGSMLDIYHINYSSTFTENVIGQAIPQSSEFGSWWDILWKDNPSSKKIDTNSNLHTIIHEIGHTIGLRHPKDDPFNPAWNTDDTIMSYNRGLLGWNDWFTDLDINSLLTIWGRENDLNKFSFDNDSSNYKFKKDSKNNYYIETAIGYEEITSINTLEFSDQSMNVKEEIIGVFDLLKGLDHITGKIYRLYNAAFSRFPDKHGLSYWINQHSLGLNNYRKIAESFCHSEEFINLYNSEENNKSYITSLYQNVLERLPDQKGFDYWNSQLENDLENRSELLMGFSESKENQSIFSAETGIF